MAPRLLEQNARGEILSPNGDSPGEPMTMTEQTFGRFDYRNAAPGAYRAHLDLETYVRASGLDHSLLELIKLRASVLNGCAYCIDMHTKDARLAGETEQRLYAVAAWHETPFFTPCERAALAWTDAVTNVARSHVPDEAYAAVSSCFSEAEIVNLTMAIIAINGWNRLAIAFKQPVGSYQPRRPQASD
jgi:AhpD family alkylhydroperoxidase